MNYEIESKLFSIKNDLFQKVEKYEWHNKNDEADRRLARLECSLRELCSEIDGIRFRVEAIEAQLNEASSALREAVDDSYPDHITEWAKKHAMAVRNARAEAFEEAAKVAEADCAYACVCQQEIAANIRAIREATGKDKS